MMPGRIGSKGNSAVTETANITWRKLHPPILCLPLSLQPSHSLFSVIQPLILISLALSRFKTCLQMQRKPSIWSLWQDPPFSMTCGWDCEKLPYTAVDVKRSLMLLSHFETFLIGSLAFFHLPTFTSSRSWRITKHQREKWVEFLLLIILLPSQASHFCSASHAGLFFSHWSRNMYGRLI